MQNPYDFSEKRYLDADLIVVVDSYTVIETISSEYGAQEYKLAFEVAEVLKGKLDGDPSIEVHWRWELPEGPSELRTAIALSRETDRWMGTVGFLTERQALRLVAGLPSDEPQPTGTDLRELTDAADAVVFAQVQWVPEGRRATVVAVEEALKGEVPVGAVLTRPESEQPGGAWRFDDLRVAGGKPGLMTGTFILSGPNSAGEWTVTNPAIPEGLLPNQVKRAMN